ATIRAHPAEPSSDIFIQHTHYQMHCRFFEELEIEKQGVTGWNSEIIIQKKRPGEFSFPGRLLPELAFWCRNFNNSPTVHLIVSMLNKNVA
ncbi:hypothetical protein, partial [uncultured Desulfovibrio sp.]|uniref:hypothetical protein n=1 Tax=uncultured Desulfovibrio sp. TaxID=167968 RepID=UPI0026708244